MKVSRKWLERYMDLSDISTSELAEKITKAGLEVEGIEKMAEADNLVIAKILECEPNPNSDHLKNTLVDTGSETLKIVCGAPNAKAGQKVIVAKPGAHLPAGEIKETVLAGYPSQGMICSLLELGVDKHLLKQEQIDGIEILDEQAPIGDENPLAYLGYDDEVLDISLTPNRADCMAINNLALEIGAILGKEVSLPEEDPLLEKAETELSIDSTTEGCPIFLGKVINEITIKPSPKWMRELLQAAGMHSINNVVDISNIVMLETGQPMHFYDATAIKEKEITVRDGYTTTYRALDDVDYAIEPEDLLITNLERPIGIAGIMGGNDSKILDTTTSLIIECALFQSWRIRSTARRLGLATEASIRYQRGVEPLAGLKAMKRAVYLLKKYADAKGIEKTVVFGDIDYKEKEIEFTLEEVNRHLGTEFSLQEILDVLERLHFRPEVKEDHITISIPSYRMDMDGMADVAEEVIRLIGYDRLPSTLPRMEMTEGKLNAMQKFIRYTRDFFLQAGLQECMTYTLVSEEKVRESGSSLEAVELNPPLSEERRFIRTGLLPSLLEIAQYNQDHLQKNINLFEIGEINTMDHYSSALALFMEGNLQESRYLHYALPADFYTLKGLIEEYLDQAGISPQRVEWLENTKDVHLFHPYQSAILSINKKEIGLIGMLHPAKAKELGLKEAMIGEINLSLLQELKKSKIKAQSVSIYPSVLRDLALLVPQEVKVMDLARHMQQKAKIKKEPVLKEVEIFDVYQGKGIEPDKKSIGLSLRFQSEKQTLDDEQINHLLRDLIEDLNKTYQAQLRS